MVSSRGVSAFAVTHAYVPCRHNVEPTMQPSALHGFCGHTVDDVGDCDGGNSGSWHIRSATSWDQAEERCRAHCASCARCHYISYSLHHRDCSWHAVCDLARLQTTGVTPMDFRTAHAKEGSALRLARGLNRIQSMPTMKWASSLAAAPKASHARPFMVQIGANDHSQDVDGGDVAPKLLKAGWRGLLVEPMPATFERLRARYTHSATVRCLNALSARACAKQGAVQFWGLDTSNATGLWGSQRADTRCVLGDPIVGWATEISSLSKAYIGAQLGSITRKPQPRTCARCARQLARDLGTDCVAEIRRALRGVRVPCIEWARELSGESAVQLLLVDAEGHDDEVLEQYPFERVETWRVVFEAARISREKFSAAATRLRLAGFRHIAGGFNSMQSVWHHLNSSEPPLQG